MENKTLSEALKNIKASEFRWEDLEEEMDEAKDTGTVAEEITDLSAYSSLFGNSTINISSNGLPSRSYLYSNVSNPVWTTNTTAGFNTISPSMEVKGDLIVNGKNIGNILDKIQDRLAILDEPSPEKLEKHAALKKAYEQYKLLEKLIGEE
jgi:hypothetical protein